VPHCVVVSTPGLPAVRYQTWPFSLSQPHCSAAIRSVELETHGSPVMVSYCVMSMKVLTCYVPCPMVACVAPPQLNGLLVPNAEQLS